MGKPPTTVIKVGSRVICNDDSGMDAKHGETLPTRGGIYTVREIVNFAEGKKCLRLDEIVNAPHAYEQGVQECSFQQSRFTAYKPGGKPR